VLRYTQFVAGAGDETTGRLIGWLAEVLAEHPDQCREIEQVRWTSCSTAGLRGD
jgi:cytochrome P450